MEWAYHQGVSGGKEGQEVILEYLRMAIDWPVGTVCSLLIYFGLIYLVRVLLLGFSMRICSYEFEVLENRG